MMDKRLHIVIWGTLVVMVAAVIVIVMLVMK